LVAWLGSWAVALANLGIGGSQGEWGMAIVSVGAGSAGLAWLVQRLRDPRRKAWVVYQEAVANLEKDVRRCAELAEQAAAYDLKLQEARFLAGVAWFMVGEYARSARYLLSVNAHASRRYAVLLGGALFNLGRYDEAIECLQRHEYGLRGGGDDEAEVEAVTLLGRCFAAKGDHRTAIEVFKRTARRGRMSNAMAQLRYAYAESLEAVGEVELAMRELRKIVAFDAQFGKAKERLARLERGRSREGDGGAGTEDSGGSEK